MAILLADCSSGRHASVPRQTSFERYLADPNARCAVYDLDFSTRDQSSVESQLQVIRAKFDGLILYNVGSQARFVLEHAVMLGYRAAVVTAWDPRSATELRQAASLASEYQGQIALAVSIGSEGLLEGRYQITDLLAAREKLSALLPAAVAITTTEPWWRYLQPGNEATALRDFGPFVCPVIHFIWDTDITDPRQAAQWTWDRAAELRRATSLPILVRESGLPGDGKSPRRSSALRFSRTMQRDYWAALQSIPPASGIKIAAFEAIDNPRKVWSDFEMSWGLLSNPEGAPYPAWSVFPNRGPVQTKLH